MGGFGRSQHRKMKVVRMEPCKNRLRQFAEPHNTRHYIKHHDSGGLGLCRDCAERFPYSGMRLPTGVTSFKYGKALCVKCFEAREARIEGHISRLRLMGLVK